MATQTPQRCGQCGACAAALRCTRCRAVWYCGETCQRSHWPVHKHMCGPQASAAILDERRQGAHPVAVSMPATTTTTTTRLDLTKIAFEAINHDAHVILEEVLRNGDATLVRRQFVTEHSPCASDVPLMTIVELVEMLGYKEWVTPGIALTMTQTLLTHALSNKASQCLELLLTMGAPGDAAYVLAFAKTGVTVAVYPLVFSLIFAPDDVTMKLIKSGIDVNKGVSGEKMQRQVSPLSVALDKRKYDCAASLLVHGADPNISCIDGVSPLMHSVLYDNFFMARLLIKYGADVRMRDTKGNTLMHYIAKLSCARTDKDKDKDMDECIGGTLIPHASMFTMLGNGLLSINSVNNKGRTPLYYALIGKNMAMVRVMAECGADISIPMQLNLAKIKFWTANKRDDIHYSISKARPEALKPVYGVTERLTLLAAAARTNNGALAIVILRAMGKTPAWQNTHSVDEKQPRTPLHIALEHESIDVVEMLVIAGADCERPDPLTGAIPYIAASSAHIQGMMLKYCHLALDKLVCIDNTYEDCFLIKEHIVPYITSHITDASAEYLRSMSFSAKLLENVVRVVDDIKTYMEIIKAETFGRNLDSDSHAAVVKKIGESKEFVHCMFGYNGDPPLILATKIGHTNVMGAIITTGADVNAISGPDGDTPLLAAVARGYKQKAVFLLECGADVMLPRRGDGKTAMQIATNTGNRAMVAALAPFVARRAALVAQ